MKIRGEFYSFENRNGLVMDRYLTYWTIRKQNNGYIKQCLLDSANIEYTPFLADALQLNTKADCERLLESKGYCFQDFTFDEHEGGVKK